LDLNDPLDCSPRIINYQPQSVDVLNERFEQNVISDAAKTLGLLCFSEAVDDPVVWSHYADCHRGIALGFCFPEKEAGFPVSYKNERAQLDYATLSVMESPNLKKVLEQGFTTKAPSWRYEREYRKFVDLDTCRMVGEHYFTSLPQMSFIQVVLGCRCAIVANDIIRLLGENTKIAVLRAKTRQDSYTIDMGGEREAMLIRP